MASQEKGAKKRKRTRNTSQDQYEMYINLLENDIVFKTGMINPTLEDNYIQKKWQELTESLNSSSEGPHMSAEEWKKRFSDWKYGVRAKARKIIEHQNKTGSGPQTDIKLTPIEDKALSLWGKVVVTGTPRVGSYDGLPAPTEVPVEINENVIVECSPQILQELSNTPQVLQEINESIDAGPSDLIRTSSSSNNGPKRPIITRVRHRPKPLSALAEKLLDISTKSENSQDMLNNTLNNLVNEFVKYKTEDLNLQKRKLNFDIAKYKYENPNFCFDE